MIVFANAVTPSIAAFIRAVMSGDKGAIHCIAGGTMPLVNFPASAIDIPKDNAIFAAAPIIDVLMSLMPLARAAVAATISVAIAAACNSFTVRPTIMIMSLISFARVFTASSHGLGRVAGTVVVVVAIVVVVGAAVEVVGAGVVVVGANVVVVGAVFKGRLVVAGQKV